ncbi:MAG: tetratricopeptide repeat protein [Bacteroidota bacterium]
MQLRGRIYMWIAGMLISGSMVCMGQEEAGDTDYQYALIEAVKQKNLGNPSEAAKLYRLVIKEKPDCDVAYYELGGIYLMSNQVELAVQALEKAYTLDSENEWYTLAYLNALGAGEHFETIEGILREKIKSDPEETEWEYQLAATYFSQEKPKKAIRTLENIEKEKGFSEKVTLLKASVYESEKEYELALLELEKVMILFPEAVQFRVVAAELCLKSGQEERAANYYLDILEADSTNIFALTNLTDYYRKKKDFSSSFIYLAKSFRNERIDARRKMAILSYYLSEEKYVNNYPGEIEKLLDVLIQMHPEEREILLMASDFHIQTRSYDKAYWNLKSYLEANGGTFPIYMQAILLANAGSLSEELVSMTGKALRYYPDSADIRFFRGLGFYGLEEYREMIDNFDSVAFENYTSKEYISQSQMLYAEACYRLRDFVKSDSIFESLIAEDPENYTVLNNYSYYLAERNEKLGEAEIWSRKAIERNPDNATFLDTYAWVLFKLGSYEEAEKYIMKALEKGGNNDPEVNEHAGEIQAALRSPDIAKSYYLKAIILGGDKATLEGKINALYPENNE